MHEMQETQVQSKTFNSAKAKASQQTGLLEVRRRLEELRRLVSYEVGYDHGIAD
jgi:hypothetical protein